MLYLSIVFWSYNLIGIRFLHNLFFSADAPFHDLQFYINRKKFLTVFQKGILNFPKIAILHRKCHSSSKRHMKFEKFSKNLIIFLKIILDSIILKKNPHEKCFFRAIFSRWVIYDPCLNKVVKILYDGWGLIKKAKISHFTKSLQKKVAEKNRKNVILY